VGVVVAGVGLWQSLADTGHLNELFFPAPSVIARALGRSLADGSMPGDIGATFRRMAIGLLIGGTAGMVTGMLMGWSKAIRGVMDPLVAAVHPIPKVALFPMFLVILGIGEWSKVAVVVAATFFPMVINSMAGVRQIGPVPFEVARNYGASRWRVFTAIVIPGSLSVVTAGVRIAVNTALLVTIAVELVGATDGLGARIWLAWQTFRVEDLYATLFVLSVLGIALNLTLDRARRWIAPWSHDEQI
jgi:NitT/TauT family transport system permease protein